ncbi:AMP-binding protein [Pontibacter chitinilyticus]|uniref:AMP-binding protein n=1 Tax=Pontibacter chitinilyticus TaxID=2674989 RepID=UPI00321ABFD7
MTYNFYQNIYDTLNRQPDTELLVWPGTEKGKAATSYTGNDIARQLSAYRQALTEQDVRPGQKVLLAIPVSFTLICALLAVMAAGAIPVLPPAKASKVELLRLLYSSGISAILSADAFAFPMRLLARILRLRLLPLAQVIPNIPAEWLPPVAVPAGQAALISHSSGSTGKPKAILRSHRVLQAQHEVLKAIFPHWPGQRDFPLFPNILLHNLSIGTTSILPDLPWADLTQLDPERLVTQINQEQVATLTGNLYYFRRLLTYLQQQRLYLLQVQAVGIGGSPIPEKLVQEAQAFFPNATFYLIYGSSEAEPIAVRKAGPEKEAPAKGYAVGPVHSSLHCQIAVLGKIILADGTTYPVGEIQVKGSHVAATQPDGWLRTGDFGYLDARQHLYLTGRQGNEQLHEGVQHYQLEHVLQHLPGVTRAAAKSAATGFDIYIEGKIEEAEVREALQQHFPAQVICRILFREQLPVDARHHSKIRYTDLN